MHIVASFLSSIHLMSILQRISKRIPTAIRHQSSMRAILIKNGTGPAENLYIGQEATPEPSEGQVQVKVRTSMIQLIHRSK